MQSPFCQQLFNVRAYLTECKFHRLQKLKDKGGIAMPNPWLYYLAAQMQHIARATPMAGEDGVNSTTALLHYVTGVDNVAEGLEGLIFAKSNKLFPTFVLMQKVWNKARQLQDIHSCTRCSPIWGNGHYAELQSLSSGPGWKLHGGHMPGPYFGKWKAMPLFRFTC